MGRTVCRRVMGRAVKLRQEFHGWNSAHNHPAQRLGSPCYGKENVKCRSRENERFAGNYLRFSDQVLFLLVRFDLRKCGGRMVSLIDLGGAIEGFGDAGAN